MNRSELVKRLMNEGLSAQTLANFSDKQLLELSTKMISEVTQKVVSVFDSKKKEDMSTLQKMANDPVTNANALKNIKITEKEKGKGEKKHKVCVKCHMEPCECKGMKKEELKGGQKKLDVNKNGKLDKEDFKLLRSKKEVKEDSKPFGKKVTKKEVKEDSKPFGKKEVGEGDKKWIQKAIKPSKKGALKKALGVKKDETIPTSKLKSAAKKGGKLGQRARLALTLKKLKESLDTEEWVDSLVENQYHNIATKGEIMELINTKMNETEVLSEIPEFMSFDSITGSKEAPVKPDIDTPSIPKENPKTAPFTKPKKPGKPEERPNPHPKAGLRK